jgi:hypothetical protein
MTQIGIRRMQKVIDFVGMSRTVERCAAAYAKSRRRSGVEGFPDGTGLESRDRADLVSSAYIRIGGRK